jgi:hypothetical protein
MLAPAAAYRVRPPEGARNCLRSGRATVAALRHRTTSMKTKRASTRAAAVAVSLRLGFLMPPSVRPPSALLALMIEGLLGAASSESTLRADRCPPALTAFTWSAPSKRQQLEIGAGHALRRRDAELREQRFSSRAGSPHVCHVGSSAVSISSRANRRVSNSSRLTEGAEHGPLPHCIPPSRPRKVVGIRADIAYPGLDRSSSGRLVVQGSCDPPSN